MTSYSLKCYLVYSKQQDTENSVHTKIDTLKKRRIRTGKHRKHSNVTDIGKRYIETNNKSYN